MNGSDSAAAPRHYAFLGFLTLLNVMNFVDRQLLGSFANFIVPDLGLTNTQFGLLTGMFFIVFYSVMGLFMGALADMVNRTRLIAAGLALWSALTALSGAARGFWTLAAPRMLIGVGESIMTPTAMSLLADRFPAARLGFASGFYYMGVPIGVGVSLLIAGYLGPAIGWRNCFYLLGGIGLALAAVMWFIKETPRRHHDAGQVPGGSTAGRTASEAREAGAEGGVAAPAVAEAGAGGEAVAQGAAEAGAGGAAVVQGSAEAGAESAAVAQAMPSGAPAAKQSFGHILKTLWFALRNCPALLLTIAGGVTSHFILGAATFDQLWYVQERGFEGAQIAQLTGWVGLVGGVLGNLFGGLGSDRFLTRTGIGRPMFLFWITVILAPFGIAYRLVDGDSIWFWLGVFFGFFQLGCFYGPTFSTVQELVPPNIRATVVAFYILLLNFIGLGLGITGGGIVIDRLIAAAVAEPYTKTLLIFTLISLTAAPLYYVAGRRYQGDRRRLFALTAASGKAGGQATL